MKIGGEAKAHEISKTQNSFGKIPPGWRDIKIINFFNGVPRYELRKIKILGTSSRPLKTQQEKYKRRLEGQFEIHQVDQSIRFSRAGFAEKSN